MRLIHLKNYLKNEGLFHIYLFLLFLSHVAVITYTFFKYRPGGNFSTVMALVGVSVPIAKASAACIELDTLLLLFPVCHELNARLRSSPLHPVLTLEKNIHYHRYLAYALVGFTAVHVCAHLINYRILDEITMRSATWYLWRSGPGLTGQLGTFSLFLLVTAAARPIRRQQYELFWGTHHLFLLFFGAMLVHGGFCFIKADTDPLCTFGGDFWRYMVAGLATYALERLLREVQGRHRATAVAKLVLHPGHTLEVHLVSPRPMATRPGQYVWLNCPAVSPWQWHPFTLTSCPEEAVLSVHIRLVGDWTWAFARVCGVGTAGAPVQPSRLPRVMVDGPFGTASDAWRGFRVLVCVGAGIGVTPFASILKSLFYQAQQRTRAVGVEKVYFYWLCREANAFSWFQTLLLALEKQVPQLVDIHIYLTGNLKPQEVTNIMLRSGADAVDVVTGLKSRTFFGKPKWENEFKKVAEAHPNTEVGVFFCGPEGLSTVLHKASNAASYNEKYNCSFYYHKENF